MIGAVSSYVGHPVVTMPLFGFLPFLAATDRRMSQAFSARDLRAIMQGMYPDVEDGRTDRGNYEHPMTAVGIVLLSAAFLATTTVRQPTAFTGYSGQFVSAIALNMRKTGGGDGEYDQSSWWLENGTIEAEQFWEHIEMACGMLWMPNAVTESSTDPCALYWDERGGLIY